MALRTKTVEYAFTGVTGATTASAAATTFTAQTVYIPETSSRTFRSVVVQFSCMDNGVTTPVSLTAVSMSTQIGAIAASSTGTITQTQTQSGENQSFMHLQDVTAYFQTNFSGTSQSITPSITITGPVTQNHYCKIIITYEFDDASATTRVKTVKIPIDGNTTTLTTAFVNVGGVASQIPNLSTFLPEASKTFRNIFFEWWYASGATATTATTLDISYDGGATTVSDLSLGSAATSDVTFHRIDNLTATLSTTTAASVQAKTPTTTARGAQCLCGVLVVTYEYNHSTTTSVMNSIQVPMLDESGLSGTSSTNNSRFERSFIISEPGTVTLAQSAVMMSYNCDAAPTVNMRMGGQTYRAFSHVATVRTGCMYHMMRFDSGAAAGSGVTWGRGTNTLTVDWYSTGTTIGTVPSNCNGIAFINYTSGVSSAGADAHNHTTTWSSIAYQTGWLSTSGMSVVKTQNTTPIIPETNYWLTSYGMWLIEKISGAAPLNYGYAIHGQVQSTEDEGAGWRTFFNGIYESDTEIGSANVMWARIRDDMKRWPQDPDTNRLDVENARSLKFDNSLVVSTTVGIIWQGYHMVTWHSIPFSVTGTISGSAGGTVSIAAYRDSDGLMIGSTSRTGNGSYSIPWYNDTDLIFVEAYEDTTHLGRSVSGYAA